MSQALPVDFANSQLNLGGTHIRLKVKGKNYHAIKCHCYAFGKANITEGWDEIVDVYDLQRGDWIKFEVRPHQVGTWVVSFFKPA